MCYLVAARIANHTWSRIILRDREDQCSKVEWWNCKYSVDKVLDLSVGRLRTNIYSIMSNGVMVYHANRNAPASCYISRFESTKLSHIHKGRAIHVPNERSRHSQLVVVRLTVYIPLCRSDKVMVEGGREEDVEGKFLFGLGKPWYSSRKIVTWRVEAMWWAHGAKPFHRSWFHESEALAHPVQ